MVTRKMKVAGVLVIVCALGCGTLTEATRVISECTRALAKIPLPSIKLAPVPATVNVPDMGCFRPETGFTIPDGGVVCNGDIR